MDRCLLFSVCYDILNDVDSSVEYAILMVEKTGDGAIERPLQTSLGGKKSIPLASLFKRSDKTVDEPIKITICFALHFNFSD
jgi:hypothetical protein